MSRWVQDPKGTGTKVSTKITTQSSPTHRRLEGTLRSGISTEGWVQRPPPIKKVIATQTYQDAED